MTTSAADFLSPATASWCDTGAFRRDTNGSDDSEKLSNRFTSSTRTQSRSGRLLPQDTHTARAGCRHRADMCAARYTRVLLRSARYNSSKCARSTRTDSYGLAATLAQGGYGLLKPASLRTPTHFYGPSVTRRTPSHTTTAWWRSGTQARRQIMSK